MITDQLLGTAGQKFGMPDKELKNDKLNEEQFTTRNTVMARQAWVNS